MSTTANQAIQFWFTEPVTYVKKGRSTAYGPQPGEKILVQAMVNAARSLTVGTSGEDMPAAATVTWAADGPLPKPGEYLILPEQYGLPGSREIIAAQRVAGNPAGPHFVEVKIR